MRGSGSTMIGRKFICGVLGIALLALSGCGYRATESATTLPPDLRTLAIPAFINTTNTYKIEQTLTQAVVREFDSRTNYHVISSAANADAVLHGTVTSASVAPLTFDSVTGRLSSAMVTVNMSVTLTSRAGKVLYQNPNYSFRQQYEVSQESAGFFQEESPAFNRLARDFAQTLVSNILENY